jgi:hypothetical protein
VSEVHSFTQWLHLILILVLLHAALCRPHQRFLPLPSSWAPVSQTVHRPWLNEQDAQETLFSSLHLYADDRFYPCSGVGAGTGTAGQGDVLLESGGGILNIPLSPLGPGPWDPKARQKLTPKQRQGLCAKASQEMRLAPSPPLCL